MNLAHTTSLFHATVPSEITVPSHAAVPYDGEPRQWTSGAAERSQLHILPASLKILRCSARAFLSGTASRCVSKGPQPVWMDALLS